MMTKHRTQFVFIIAAGLSLISGFSQTAPATAGAVAVRVNGTIGTTDEEANKQRLPNVSESLVNV